MKAIPLFFFIVVVRLVSGRHLKEFADFLAAQKDFVVEGDRVRLRNMPEPKAAKPEEFVDEEGRPLAGHKAKLAAIQYMTSVLEQVWDNNNGREGTEGREGKGRLAH